MNTAIERKKRPVKQKLGLWQGLYWKKGFQHVQYSLHDHPDSHAVSLPVWLSASLSEPLKLYSHTGLLLHHLVFPQRLL